ncbi:unnamed protein product [Effrenium voratum]|nr:unnamed protein product [Effrenium voratum]
MSSQHFEGDSQMLDLDALDAEDGDELGPPVGFAVMNDGSTRGTLPEFLSPVTASLADSLLSLIKDNKNQDKEEKSVEGNNDNMQEEECGKGKSKAKDKGGQGTNNSGQGASSSSTKKTKTKK